jgi:tetratricopeptide (TPR) repeat protein
VNKNPRPATAGLPNLPGEKVKKRNLIVSLMAVLLCGGVGLTTLTAQMGVLVAPRPIVVQPPSNPQAKTKYDEGNAAIKNNDYAAAVAAFRQVIEIEPDYLPGHHAFMNAVRTAEQEKEKKRQEELKRPEEQKAATPLPAATAAGESKKTPEPEKAAAQTPPQGETNALPVIVRRSSEAGDKILQQAYKEWAGQYPDKAVFQWALGTLSMSETDKAQQYFLNAVSLNPKFLEAYQSLAQLAGRTHDVDGRRTYLKKVVELSPQDTNSFFDLALTYRYVDSPTFVKLTDDLVARFPKDNATIRALSCRADDADDPAERLALLEKARKDFQGNPYANSAMKDLFRIYSREDMVKGLAFAQDMVKLAPFRRPWTMQTP